jgi:hypothetical protein
MEGGEGLCARFGFDILEDALLKSTRKVALSCEQERLPLVFLLGWRLSGCSRAHAKLTANTATIPAIAETVNLHQVAGDRGHLDAPSSGSRLVDRRRHAELRASDYLISRDCGLGGQIRKTDWIRSIQSSTVNHMALYPGKYP